MAWASVVDYMKANKQDASFSNRAKIAAQYGIKGYQGTAGQNTQLLNYMQTKKPVTTTKPVASPVAPTVNPPQPTAPTSPSYSNWMDAINHSTSTSGYNGALNGTNTRLDYNGHVMDTNNADWINQALAGGAKVVKSNLGGYNGQNVDYHALSIAALKGDTAAQAFLKALGNSGQQGSALWNGVTQSDFDANGQAFRAAYVKDNPYADITKNYEMNNYNAMSDWIKNGKPITNDQLQSYQNIVDKWNLQDQRNPYVQQQQQLQADKTNALNAQDVALNQGMAQMDANSFNQFQQLQQQMASRGMGDSGIAADAYMRSQMANNQNYQQAFANAATKKSDLATQYDQDIANSKVGQLKNQQDQQAQSAKNAIDMQNAQIELSKVQNTQDQWLTTQTGMVYIGGKPVTDSKGQPIRTVDWYKMTETERHNMATENNTATKNANDYALGADKNAIARQKIAADLQTSAAKMKLEYSKLDFNYAKLDANNKEAQDKLDVARANAQTSADRNKIDSLKSQLNSVTSRMTAAQKAGNKPSKDDVDNYNSILSQLSALAGNFKDSSGGGDTTSPSMGNLPSGNYNNYYKYGKQPSSFNSYMQQAIQGNGKYSVPFSDAKMLTELIGRESSWSPTAANPSSSARGFGQFLSSTRSNYEKKMGISYSNPVNQILMTYQYCKDRYGSVANALAFWDKHKWY